MADGSWAALGAAAVLAAASASRGRRGGSAARRPRKADLIDAILRAADIAPSERRSYRPWLKRLTVEELRAVRREVIALLRAA